MPVLIRQGDLSWFETGSHGGDRVDVMLADGHIAQVGPDLPVPPGTEVFDAHGAAVVPGLHDHHVHLRALAAARHSVVLDPGQVRTVQQLSRQLSAASAGLPPDRWLRVVGYHQSVAGDLDRWALDRLCSSRPVRVQHSGGSLWVLNSKALDAAGIDERSPAGVERDAQGQLTGRIWREDRWLAARVPAAPLDLDSMSREAVARGVTGFTDATPGQGAGDLRGLANAVDSGAILQRLHLMADIGVPCPDTSLATLGPVKVMLDDTTLPTLDELVELVEAVHRSGRPVAVHCVTRVQAVLTVAALTRAGSFFGDRMEHGAILASDLLAPLRQLGITVVTQPGLLAVRGDRYLADVDLVDRVDLWRFASLVSAAVPLALGTDAPFGPSDPWGVVRAAVTREAPSGAVVGLAEAVTGLEALRLFAGRPADPSVLRTVRPGEPADLCVFDWQSPWTDGHPDVLATIIGGEVVYRNGGAIL